MTGGSTHTVNIIIKAYKEEKRICDAPHDRRPRATTEQQEQVLVAGAYASPFNTAKEVGECCGVEASVSILKRRFAEQGLRSRIAAQKPHLSRRNKTSRMGFAVNHAAWTVNDWKDVIFSDETTVPTVWDQKRRVWRPDCTRYEQCYLQEVATSGRTTVNISGAMSRDGLGALHRIGGNLTAEKYANIVEYVLIPYALDGSFPDVDYYYQHDLSPVHTAKRVKRLLYKRAS
ncbi:hypothetical protein HPB52_000675 [Rhipicephalus sanguineus]|uniref:Transposase Tc1-like domain-containing protein n=1 Tax=Rhipicephalus sanguineus TaxID=34632 RepID=A0A9D4QGK9_RHISA|nr:hypothetical protein HPB52_000675 [Rhipicephalus sanguineus]